MLALSSPVPDSSANHAVSGGQIEANLKDRLNMRLLIAAALILSFVTQASAKDEEWTGGYIGLSLGYADANDAWDLGSTPTDPVLTPEGASFGAYAGYTKNLGGLVVGLEADLTFPDLSDNAECTVVIDCTFDVQVLSSIRARAGVAVGPVQLYGTGGLAFGFIQADSNELGGTSASESLSGWTLGGGIETQLSDSVRVGIEYRHSDYGNTGIDIGIPAGDINLETNEVRLKLGIAFD